MIAALYFAFSLLDLPDLGFVESSFPNPAESSNLGANYIHNSQSRSPFSL